MVETQTPTKKDAAADQVSAAKFVAPASEPKAIFSARTANITAVVSSVIASVVTFWSKAETMAHKNLSSRGLTEELKRVRTSKGAEITAKVYKVPAAYKKGVPIQDKLYTAEMAHDDSLKLGQWFEEEKKAIFKAEGYGTFRERLKVLRPHQKWELALSTLTAGGIALAGIVLLSHDMFSNKDRKDLGDRGKEGARDATDDQGVQR